METLQALRNHIRRYPQGEPQDWIKLLYQSEFGPGHWFEAGMALDRVRNEWTALAPGPEEPLFEPVGGGYARLNFRAAKRAGLRPETICGLFAEALRQPGGSMGGLQGKLDGLLALSRADDLLVDGNAVQTCVAAYRSQGCPSVRHSEKYRRAYAPAYRLAPGALSPFAELFIRIDALLARQPEVIVSIDGNCASGKSTLSEALARIYGARLIRIDDFFVPPGQKTPERMATPGGNIDYERFQAEIGACLRSRVPFAYRPYNCFTDALDSPVTVLPNRLTIVDGVYSQHPALRHLYDLKVVLSIDPARQSDRLLRRNGAALHRRFLNEWIPLEELYLTGTRVREQADLVYCV